MHDWNILSDHTDLVFAEAMSWIEGRRALEMGAQVRGLRNLKLT